MNGKELKVAEYNLTFGANIRIVNVFSLFRYKKNNGLYVIYGDQVPTQPVINYGTSHIKGDTILSMTPKPEDQEIIKEFIFKITSSEELNDFEIISLNEIENIEIIASNHLEVKPEILTSLTDKTMPKKETEETEKVNKATKKKKHRVLPLLIILALGAGGYYYYTQIYNQPKETKSITCNKQENDSSINAMVITESTYNFNNNDILESIETTQTYSFQNIEAYQEFINKGLIYKYMPDDKGGYKQEDETNSIVYIVKENIDSNYTKTKDYEELLSENKRDGFTCEEKIIK